MGDENSFAGPNFRGAPITVDVEHNAFRSTGKPTATLIGLFAETNGLDAVGVAEGDHSTVCHEGANGVGALDRFVHLSDRIKDVFYTNDTFIFSEAFRKALLEDIQDDLQIAG